MIQKQDTRRRNALTDLISLPCTTDKLISGNGYIEGRELDHFLREFVASVSANDLGADVSSKTRTGRGELGLLSSLKAFSGSKNAALRLL